MLIFSSVCEGLLLLASVTVAALAAFLLLEVSMACMRARLAPENAPGGSDDNDVGSDIPFAVVIPAHNEELLVDSTVTSLLPHLKPADRLIVVADNCTDDTAQRAFDAGAEVLVRSDTTHRGKGYAIQWAMDFLADSPPEAVVVWDADCELVEGSLNTLVHRAIVLHRPVQAAYQMPVAEGGSISDRISAFAVVLKNIIRPTGLRALGGPCLLTGTGMAFPWAIASTTRWASSDIVEDMTIGIELARAGTPPAFDERVLVSADLPSSKSAAKQQRTRWEHGHVRNIYQSAPALLTSLAKRPSWSLVCLVLELAVPPLALFALLLFVLLGTCAIAALLGASLVALIFCLAACCLFAIAITAAWIHKGSKVLPLRELIFVPRYIVGKLSIYSSLVTNPETEWRRTDRGAVSPSSPYALSSSPRLSPTGKSTD